MRYALVLSLFACASGCSKDGAPEAPSVSNGDPLTAVCVPAPWATYTFWQYDTTNDMLDKDVFQGTLADLRAFARSSVLSIPSGAPRCPYGPGLYCGGNAVAGDPTKLYSCNRGALTEVGTCVGGCRRNAIGRDDECARACPLGNGHYCGADGVPGDRSTLYQCTDGVVVPIQTCAAGCLVTAAGEADRCR